MNIALVTYSLKFGGVEIFIQTFADYCQEKGHKVTIIETVSEGSWTQLFRDRGYQVKQIFPQAFKSKISHVKRIAKTLSEYDLIILNDAPYAQSGIGLLPNKIVTIPVLHLNHISMIRNATANSINWDIISAVTPGMKDCIMRFGIDEKKIIIVPYGISVPSEWPKKAKVFSVTDPLRIIFIGQINHFHKGVFYLPGILKRVIEKNIKIKVDIVGDGPDLQALRQQFTGISPAIYEFHGALSNDNTMQLLEKADVLIMPSHFEGQGIVLLEAMSKGVVPIASKLGKVTDFAINNDVDGYLVTVGDEKGFADAIMKLACDRNNLRNMSKAAWQNAASRFAYQIMGNAYLSIAEDLLNQRKSSEKKRTGEIDKSLLGDFPDLPFALVRPARVILRKLGLYKDTIPEPAIFNP